MNQTRYFSLFITFAKIGLFTFGGGMSMLPMLERECVEKHKWASREEMLNYFSIGQCTPGIIAVNTATFIGYKNRGILGAIFATLGIVFPSFVIIILLSSVLLLLSSNYYVSKAFTGIRIAVSALLTVSVFKIAKSSLKKISSCVIAFLSLCLEIILKISPIFIVLLTVLYSVIIYLVDKNSNKSNQIKEIGN